jgi:hypothetical protein
VHAHEDLARHRVAPETALEAAANPAVPAKKAEYAKPLCQYIAHHKTAAVAEMLLASPRTAQEVRAVQMLVTFKLHLALEALAKEAEPQAAYRILEAQARQVAAKLGLPAEEGESVWTAFPTWPGNEMRGLPDHDLASLLNPDRALFRAGRLRQARFR